MGRPHGIHGAVRVRPTGDTLGTLGPGSRVEVGRAGAQGTPMWIAAVGGTRDHPIVHLQGVDDRDAAGALTGAELRVEEDRVAVPREADTYLVRDLIGCRVLAGTRELGAVVAIHPAPANDALEVTGPEGTVLIPFTADAVDELDVPGRRIVIRPDLL